MTEIFENLNPMIVDAVFIAILVLIVFFGMIKGTLKTVASFIVFGASAFLGFSKYSNPVKKIFVEEIFKIEKWLPVGSTNALKFGASLLSSVLASLAVFLVAYIVLNAIISLFKMIVRKKSKGNKHRKSMFSRFFGGVLSLVCGGAVVMVFLFAVNNNFIGMKGVISKSKVTSFVVEKSEKILEKIDDDLVDVIVIKFYVGDSMYNVDRTVLNAFNHVEESANDIMVNENYLGNIENKPMTNEETSELIKSGIIDLYNLAILSNEFDEIDKSLTEKYPKMAGEILVAMSRKITNDGLSAIEFNHNERGKIRQGFEDAGLNDEELIVFDNITSGK